MLRETFRKLLRNTTGFSVTVLVAPLFNLILTPIYTNILGTERYGIVDLLTTVISTLYVLGLLGMTTALPSLYFASDDEQARRDVMANVLLVTVAVSVGLALIVAIGAEQILGITVKRPEDASHLRLLALGQPFAIVYALQGLLLRLKTAVWRSNLLALAYALVYAGANLTFVVWLRWGVGGVVAAQTSTNIVMGCLGLALAPDALRGRLAPGRLRGVVAAGLPLLPMAFGGWLIAYEDRFFLARSVSEAEIGVYGFAIKLASILGLALLPFQAAWTPLALSIKDQPQAKSVYTRTMLYFLAGSLGLGLALSLYSHEATLILSNATYLGARDLIWLLVMMPISAPFHYVVLIGLYITQRVGLMSWSVVIAMIVNTILNIVLIPHWGIMGAAAATGAAYALAPVATAIIAQRIYPLPFAWGRAALIAGGYIGCALLALMIEPRAEPGSMALRAGLLLVYAVIVWLALDRHERQLLVAAIQQPKRLLAWVARRG